MIPEIETKEQAWDWLTARGWERTEEYSHGYRIDLLVDGDVVSTQEIFSPYEDSDLIRVATAERDCMLRAAASDLYEAAKLALATIQGRQWALAGAEEAEEKLRVAIAEAEADPEVYRAAMAAIV